MAHIFPPMRKVRQEEPLATKGYDFLNGLLGHPQTQSKIPNKKHRGHCQKAQKEQLPVNYMYLLFGVIAKGSIRMYSLSLQTMFNELNHGLSRKEEMRMHRPVCVHVEV